MRSRLPQLALLIACLLITAPARSLELSDYPKLQDFIAEMERKHDFDSYVLEQLFEEVDIRQDIITIMNTPGEAKPWYQYKDQFVTRLNAKRGVRFWKKWKRELEHAQHQYGVDIEIILGIIGVETQFGINRGRHRVIDALTTLAFAFPRRNALFRRELEQFLILARELKHNPLTVTGSYAGAIGLPQFLPSSYREYAVDFDRDNIINLMGSETDAIGSIANYLKVHGWQRGEPTIDDAQVNDSDLGWLDPDDIKPSMSLFDLKTRGINATRHTDNNGRKAALLRLQGKNNDIYRLGFDNFYVITRYNRSTKYAIAVIELGNMIKDAYDSEK